MRLGQTGSSRNVLPRAALQGDGKKSHHWHSGGRSLCGPLAPVTDQWMRKQSEMRSRSMDSAQLVIPALPLCFIHCPLPKSPKTMVRVVPGRTKMGQRGKKKRTRKRNKPRSGDKGEKGKEVFIQQLLGAEEPQVNRCWEGNERPEWQHWISAAEG